MQTSFSNSDFTFLTCSYMPDLEIFSLLCETIDRFAPDVNHVVVVPKSDMEAFSRFKGLRRMILVQDDFLPPAIFRIPMPPIAWRQRFRFPKRDQFLSLPCRRVSGWIMQQLFKLECAASLDAEIVIHLDSDACLTRPFDPATYVDDGGRVRLFKEEVAVDTEAHRAWAQSSCDILDLEDGGSYLQRNYVSWPVVWRSSVVRMLKANLESGARRDWRYELSALRYLSEYQLYGLFAETHPAAAELHYTTEQKLMMIEAYDVPDPENAARQAFDPTHIGCCLQSGLSQDLVTRRGIIDEMIAMGERAS